MKTGLILGAGGLAGPLASPATAGDNVGEAGDHGAAFSGRRRRTGVRRDRRRRHG